MHAYSSYEVDVDMLSSLWGSFVRVIWFQYKLNTLNDVIFGILPKSVEISSNVCLPCSTQLLKGIKINSKRRSGVVYLENE